MPMNINRNETAGAALAAAFASGDEAQLAEAWNLAMESVAEQVRENYAQLADEHDAQVLASRGIRQLTTAETAFYERLAGALRSANPEQAFVAAPDTDPNFMPSTIIDSVLDQLEQDHPLLSHVRVQPTGYNGVWLRDKGGVVRATWGKVDAAITEELAAAIDVKSTRQSKLSAFCIVPLDILDMGPAFMDAYVRGLLYEAMYEGIDYGIVLGTGVGEPIGMARDIHDGVSVSTTTGYPMKTAVALESFKPADFLAKVGTIAKTEHGKNRRVPEVLLIASQATFLTKIWPAVLAPVANGGWNKSYPFPVTEVVCNALADNKALIGLPNGYTFAVGGSRNGNIEFSDDAKFIEDCRAFKVVQHGDGMAADNTAFVYLDVSAVEAWSMPVYDMTPAGE